MGVWVYSNVQAHTPETCDLMLSIMNHSNNNLGLIIIIAIGVIILLFWLSKKFKKLKLPNVFLVDGAPKTGKSALSLCLAHRVYMKNCFKWCIGKAFYWLRYHTLTDYPLKPMFYTNIPVGFTHNMLTREIIYLEVKVPPKSVIFIDEASLFADSQLIKDRKLNMKLTLFCKLIGHVTRGGTLAINSQQCSDLHYSFKRVLGRYLYIYDTIKFPFVSVSQVREMMYSDDTSIVNDINEDAELSMRKIFFFNGVYKRYDCFCYYNIVKERKTEVDYDYKFDKKDLSAKGLISFNQELSDEYAHRCKGDK